MEHNRILLLEACRLNNLEEVKRLFPLSVDSTQHEYTRLIPLIGISNGDIIKYVVRNIKDERQLGFDLLPLFYNSCKSGNSEITEIVVRKMMTRVKDRSIKWDLLRGVCYHGLVDAARSLIGDDVCKDYYLLYSACDSGSIPMIEFIIGRGVNLNFYYGTMNEVPLHHFCHEGISVEILECLIKHGADVNFRDPGGQTALHYACITDANKDNTAVIDLLLKHGAHIEAKDNSGRTALALAVRYANRLAAEKLLAEGASSLGYRYQSFSIFDCGVTGMRRVLDMVMEYEPWKQRSTSLISSQMPYNEESPLHHLGVCIDDIANLIYHG